MIPIPYERLSKDALRGLLEEFVMREGTDYGAYNAYRLQDKVAFVYKQLEAGQVLVTYDEETESCTILTKQNYLELEKKLEKERSSILVQPDAPEKKSE